MAYLKKLKIAIMIILQTTEIYVDFWGILRNLTFAPIHLQGANKSGFLSFFVFLFSASNTGVFHIY